MSVYLQKGQNLSLKKKSVGGGFSKNEETLKNIMIGLGWDEVSQSSSGGGFLSFLFGGGGDSDDNIDCDAYVFMMKRGKFDDDDVVYFGNLEHYSDSVVHKGDNLTGEGDGDDERVFVNLQKVPSEYDKLVFVVNIFDAKERHQHFGRIKNAFIRICDADTNTEICRYNLSENYSGKTAVILGEITRNGSEWNFNAVGNPPMFGGAIARFLD